MKDDLHIELDHDAGEAKVAREVMRARTGTLTVRGETLEVRDVLVTQQLLRVTITGDGPDAKWRAP